MGALAASERDKYAAIWERPEYRQHSPGLAIASRALDVMRPDAGETLADFGAGTGRATAWFRDHWIEATAIDFAEDALETTVPFVAACLWDMPADLGPFDHGFCADVMEHIPTEKVDAVLRGIASRVRRGCFFQIAMFHDGMGALIGKTLHLTVQPADWWTERMLKHFGKLTDVRSRDGYFTCLARP